MEKIKTSKPEQTANAKAKKTMMMLAMASFTMMFAGLTSAYVVSKSRPDWVNDFEIPTAFTISTIALLISSVTMFLAKKRILSNQRKQATVLLFVTLLMGCGFVFLQFQGFSDIIANGFYFTGPESSPTASFFYVIVIMHILHLIAGLIVLLVVIYNHYKHRYNKDQMLGFELGAMFWHFLDILWLYLFLFFVFYR